MTFDPSRHHRRSVRLHGYDYAREGAYFMTVCTQGKACLFGEVVGGAMRLNEAGRMVEEWWNEVRCKFPDREIDEYVVMPNHFHGIVIVGADLCVRPDVHAPSIERGRTRRFAPTEDHPMVQNDDHKCLPSWCQRKRMAAVSRQSLAAQLLRAHHPG
jgi:hypothetical protein